MIVRMKIHDELTVDPSLMKDGKTIRNFQSLLGKAYAPPLDQAIVPLGTDWAAATYYGQPAMKLGLKYMEYKIVPEESSLYESYERNDPVLTDPDSINSKGWWETKKVYLDGQNVRPSLKRLKKFLVNAYSYSLSSAQAITDVGNLQND